MSDRWRGLASFSAAALWPPVYDFLKSVLHDRIIHMIDPYLAMIPPEWLIKYGPSVALAVAGLWFFFHTAKATKPKAAAPANGHQKPKTVADEFSEWFNRSTADRDGLMAAVNNAYEIWRSGRNDSETLGKLNRLVDGVKFPFSEATTSEDMGKRIRRSVMNFDYSARSLFQFSESIYPSDHPVTTNGWIDEERRDLSKRFDELGRQLYNQDGIVFDEVRNMILNQSRLIKVLTFLEFAQCAQRDTPGPGKYGLFYLCSKLAD